MVVPVAMVELDEADAALGEPAREQAVGGEGARLFRIRPVQIERVLRALSKDRSAPAPSLHAKRHLILRDARGDFRIAEFCELPAGSSLLTARRDNRGDRRWSNPAGSERYSTGSPTERNFTP